MNNEEQLKINTGENEVPLAPPPPQNLNVRTLQSDLESLQQTGGQIVKPYNPEISSKNQSQDQIFQPPQIETPATAAGIPNSPDNNQKTTEQTPKKKNKLASIIIIVLIIVAAAAVGYFFVYPALVAPKTTTEQIPQQPTTEPTTSAQPSEQPIPSEPTVVPQLPSALNLATIETHASYFKSPTDFTRELNLVYADLNSLKELIGSRTNENPVLEEIIIKNEQNKVISFSGLMPLFAPNFFTSSTLNYFEDDYTLYTYINNQGSWLGIIAKLKNNADVAAIQNQMSNLQKDPDNRNFFLTNPGSIGVWRDGKIKNKPSSIVDFEKAGASLSYTWFDKYLLLSTNIDGATEAATRLGF